VNRSDILLVYLSSFAQSVTT